MKVDFRIIIKRVEGKLTEKEEIVFQHWYQESQDHRDYYQKILENHRQSPGTINKEEGWNKIEKRLQFTKNSGRKMYWNYGAVAATILFILGVIGTVNYYSNSEKTNTRLIVSEVPSSVIRAGSDKAVLTLEDGSEVTLGDGSELNRDNLMSNGKELVYHADGENDVVDIKYNILTIPKGGEFFLQLSDGTKVWLNSDSRIKYPVDFTYGRERVVELLYGEAFFEVSSMENNDPQHTGSERNKKSYFQVITGEQRITVLGTQFNVRAYADENKLYSTLVEGLIELEYSGQKKKLNPNNQAVIHPGNSEISINTIDVYNEIAWVHGVFGFDNTSLGEIMKVLSRWYDVEVIFESEHLKDILFTGALRKKQDLEDIMEIISLSNGIDYQIVGQSIIMK